MFDINYVRTSYHAMFHNNAFENKSKEHISKHIYTPALKCFIYYMYYVNINILIFSVIAHAV